MKKISYSVATPSFVSSQRDYLLRANSIDTKSKLYGLRVDILSAFLDRSHDYPVKLPATNRLSGIIYEDVPVVAERILTVDSVIMRYVEGGRVEKGAVIHASQEGSRNKDFDLLLEGLTYGEFVVDTFLADILHDEVSTLRRIDFILDIVQSDAFASVRLRQFEAETILSYLSTYRNPEKTITVLHVDDGIQRERTFNSSIVEDEAALNLLRVTYGRIFVDTLIDASRRLDKDTRIVESQITEILLRVLNASLLEFSSFQGQGIPTYIPELIWGKIERDEDAFVHEIDRASYDSETDVRLVDVEFHYRKQDMMPDGRMFDDYDLGIRDLTYECNEFMQHYDLFDRVVEVFDARFYDTEIGMRQKFLTGVDNVRIFDDGDTADRVILEYIVSYLEYDRGLKPRTVDAQDVSDMTLGIHNMTYLSSYSDSIDWAQRDIEYAGHLDMHEQSQRDTTHDSILGSEDAQGVRDATYDLNVESFFDFQSQGTPVYMHEFDSATKIDTQLGSSPDEYTIPVNRLNEHDTVRDEAISWSRAEYTWQTEIENTHVSEKHQPYTSNVEDMTESSTYRPYIETMFDSTDISGRVVEETDARSIDLEFHLKVDDFLADIQQSTDWDRVTPYLDADQVDIELSNRKVEIVDTMIERLSAAFVDNRLFDLTLLDSQEALRSILRETLVSTLQNASRYVEIEASEESLTDGSILDRVFDTLVNEFDEFKIDARETYMHDFDLFNRIDDDNFIFIETSTDVYKMQDRLSDIVSDFESPDILREIFATEVISMTGGLKRAILETHVHELGDDARRADMFDTVWYESTGTVRSDTFDLELYESSGTVRRDEFVAETLRLERADRIDDFRADVLETALLNRLDTHIASLEEIDRSSRIDSFLSVMSSEDQSLRRDSQQGYILGDDISTLKQRVFDTLYETSTESRKSDNYLASLVLSLEFALANDYTALIEELLTTQDRQARYSDIVQFTDSKRENSPKDVYQYDMEIGEAGYLDVSLIEYDLFRRIDDDNFATIEAYFTATSERPYDGWIDTVWTGNRLRDTYSASLGEVQGSVRPDEYQSSLDETSGTNRVDTYRTDVADWAGGRRDDLWSTSIENLNAALRSDEWLTLVDTSTLADRLYEVIRTELIDFDLGEIDREFDTAGESIYWFTRIEVEAGAPETVTWSTRSDTVETAIEMTDVFGRQEVEGSAPYDTSIFTRPNVVDVKLEETVKAIRDMLYNATIEESDGFFGPDDREYTWLWHSRPNWWSSWNWKKTK